jgi:hypothetical protein
MRAVNGNSARLAEKLKKMLKEECETVRMAEYTGRMSSLINRLYDAPVIVLCMPLYVDGIPSQMIRLMELFQSSYTGKTKKIYVLANMGLYESSQLVNLFSAVREWCGIMNFSYGGGAGVSAGELIGVLMQYIPFRIGPAKNAAGAVRRLADAVSAGSSTDDIFAEPFCFPRPLYILIANRNWNTLARRNGIRPADLYRTLRNDLITGRKSIY